jgi:hypothetical protein
MSAGDETSVAIPPPSYREERVRRSVSGSCVLLCKKHCRKRNTRVEKDKNPYKGVNKVGLVGIISALGAVIYPP